MPFSYLTYTILWTCLFICIFPAFFIYVLITGKYRKHLWERLGFIPQRAIQRITGSPRIWIHAVSLGEVKAAAAVIQAVRKRIPKCGFMISTTTEHGRDLAETMFGAEMPVIYSPIDLVFCVRRALSSVRPHIMVFLETEIWPSWVTESRRKGAKLALVNGRISKRSFKRYARLRFLFRSVLMKFDALSMIHEGDAARIRAMGADAEKTVINGNAKFDLFELKADLAVEDEIRALFNLKKEARLFIAGSTRRGEEAMILRAYEKVLQEYPDTILVIAPRHLKRVPDVLSLLGRKGFGCHLRSDLDLNTKKRTEQIIILDTFGELFNVYSVGTVVFCGGSLVPLGGQNPLEPAIWGKPVLYGPSMENFPDASALLESVEAALTVADPESLADSVLQHFRHPTRAVQAGQRGREAVLENRGAAKKHAAVIAGLIKT